MDRREAPLQIVEAALGAGASSIAYTYTEPTIFYELASETAKLARESGLRNIFVTNGFTSEPVVRELSTVLDAANIDLKFFDEGNYRRIAGARLKPILDTIRLYHELGVWIEVTTLVIPGVNDSEEELRSIASFIHSVDPDVPWHVSQFYPAYKMLDAGITPLATLEKAYRIGQEAGIQYVYGGNVPGEKWESTFCPSCREELIRRYGFMVQGNRIRNGRCPSCDTAIAGVEMDGRSKEEDH